MKKKRTWLIGEEENAKIWKKWQLIKRWRKGAVAGEREIRELNEYIDKQPTSLGYVSINIASITKWKNKEELNKLFLPIPSNE